MSKELEMLIDLYQGGLTKEYKLECYKKLEKSLKALEIIKEKVSVDKDVTGLYWFNLIDCAGIGITKEEYDLLKEVLL